MQGEIGGLELGNGVNGATFPETRAAESTGLPAAHGERLAYIADMAQQLRAMAGQVKECRTLVGLLDLAYQEAVERLQGC
jgi:hypothetical protein